MTKFEILQNSGKNIFNIDDLSSLWRQKKRADTTSSIKKYVKSGKVFRLKKGLYTLDKSKIKFAEVASRALAPSYITGETALAEHSQIFPASNEIHSASTKTKYITIDGVNYIYHGLKSAVFFNPQGIENRQNYSIASLERAVADLIYYYSGKYDFERLNGVDWEKLEEIGQIYQKKVVAKRIKELRSRYEF